MGKNPRDVKPADVEALVMMKNIYAESNGPTDAKKITSIATSRGLPLSRYVVTRLMKE